MFLKKIVCVNVSIFVVTFVSEKTSRTASCSRWLFDDAVVLDVLEKNCICSNFVMFEVTFVYEKSSWTTSCSRWLFGDVVVLDVFVHLAPHIIPFFQLMFESTFFFNFRTLELGSAPNQEFLTLILNPRIAFLCGYSMW